MATRADWKGLAGMIREQDAPDLRVLIIVNSRLVVNEVVARELEQGFPAGTHYNFVNMQFVLPKGAVVDVRSVASEVGIHLLLGLQYDCIFFDPAWIGSAEWRQQILTSCRRSHAGRTT